MNNIYISLITISFLLNSCSNHDASSITQTDSIQIKIDESKQFDICKCDSTIIDKDYTFSKPEVFLKLDNKQNIAEQIEKWNSVKKSVDIKILELQKVRDSIPTEIFQFSNIETLIINSSSSLIGISKFKKLKKIELFAYSGILPSEIKELDIDIFVAEKAAILHFENIENSKSIKELVLSASYIDSFPQNSNFMQCIQRLEIIGYNGVSIDFTSHDFTNLSCLKVLSLESNKNNLFGIPSGIENHRFHFLNIDYPKLTEKEKTFLKAIIVKTDIN